MAESTATKYLNANGKVYFSGLFKTRISHMKFNNSLKFITDVKMKGSMSIANMNTQTSNHMIQAFMHSTTSSESEMAKVEGEIKRLNGIIEAEMKVYEPLMTNNIEKARCERIYN